MDSYNGGDPDNKFAWDDLAIGLCLFGFPITLLIIFVVKGCQ